MSWCFFECNLCHIMDTSTYFWDILDEHDPDYGIDVCSKCNDVLEHVAQFMGYDDIRVFQITAMELESTNGHGVKFIDRIVD